MKNLVASTLAVATLLVSTAALSSTIPAAANWTVNTTTLQNRASPGPTTSITDVYGGVLLQYDELSGGNNVGTATRQYDYTTGPAIGPEWLDLNIQYNAFHGFFQPDTGLFITLNNIIHTALIPFANNAGPGSVNALFKHIDLHLQTGDIWGIRAIAGNFDSGPGVTGNIRVTVPEPGTLAILGLGLAGLGFARRRKTV